MLCLGKKFLFLFLLMPKFLWHVKQYVVCLRTAYGVFFFFFFLEWLCLDGLDFVRCFICGFELCICMRFLRIYS